MAASQNLVLADRQSTPVNHTFVPAGKPGVDAVRVRESLSGIPEGSNTYSVAYRRTASGAHKATLRMAVPVVVTETINGVNKQTVLRTSYVEAVFTFADSSTTAERNNFVGMFADSLGTGKVLVNDTIVNLNAPY